MLGVVVLTIRFVSTINIVLIIEIVSTKDILVIFKSVVVILIVRFIFAKVLFVNIKTK